VYPERQKKGDSKAKEKWWIYLRNRIDSYRKIASKKHVLVNAVVSKYPVFIRHAPNIVFSNKNTLFDIESFFDSVLFSTIYSEWVYKHLNTMRAETINYSISENFENYPFPQNLTSQQKQRLESTGEAYHECRRQLMLDLGLGLTKIYNLFHSNSLIGDNINEEEPQVASLSKHLVKGTNAISINSAIKGVSELRTLRIQMDNAVLDAYGWNNILLDHNFYEVDYLPEHDRVRFTIHPEARKEMLKRLLELNHKVHAEEQLLNETKHLVSKNTKKAPKTKQLSTQLLFPMRPETAYGAIYSVQDIVRITKISSQTIKRWFNRLYSSGYEGISKDNNSREHSLLLNFYGVNELIVIYDLRVKNKIPLKDILDARKWLINRFGNMPGFYPFTSQPVLDTINKAGKQIIFTDEKTSDFITLGRGNLQLNLDFIKDIFKRIVFDKEMVSRLYLSDSHLIAIDPSLAGGRPCTVENEILIDSIKSVYLDSKNAKYIAGVYDISESAVEDALKFEQASALN
jgi:uncharacterized protein (DUF433 family)